jgi:hypothetical protein
MTLFEAEMMLIFTGTMLFLSGMQGAASYSAAELLASLASDINSIEDRYLQN